LEPFLEFGKRLLEVALDVVVESLERRHIEDVHRVRQRPLESVDDEVVELPEERRQRFPCARWRQDQRVLTAGDRRPSPFLRRARRAERFAKPVAYKRMERGERARHAEGPERLKVKD